MTPSLASNIVSQIVSQVPEPRLRVVENLTPFTAFQCDKMGAGRKFHDTVVVKGTFTLSTGRLRIAPVQRPIVLADHYWSQDAPERSSVKSAGDALLVKPSTDVLITGTACSPEGRPLRGWDVAVVVKDFEGTVLEHRLQVTGPRKWQYRSLRGWTLSSPEPAAEVPIRYELAYGGACPDRRYPPAPDGRRKWLVHRPNPSGSGFFDERALDPGAEHTAPQWQSPQKPVKAINEDVPVAGLGPVARHWSSRTRYAGTYDDAWQSRTRDEVRRGLPADYPADFDPRFFQCAHPDLITNKYLLGDEIVALSGLSREHEWLVMQLPCLSVQASLLDGTSMWREENMPLDTVHVDMDAAEVHLSWRLSLDQRREVRVAVISMREPR